MIDNHLVRNVLRFEYRLLRTPLATLDQYIVAPYLAADSPVRVTLERGLDTLDAVAAQLLQPPAADPQSRSSEPLPADEQEEAEELAADLLHEEENDRFTGELADENMRRVQAELRAKHTVEERHEDADGQ